MASQQSNWNKYFYPGTEVLVNKHGIRDSSVLGEVEHELTGAVTDAFNDGLIEIKGDSVEDKLKFIHAELFGNLYDWAGQRRDVDIQKGGHHFGDHLSLGMYMKQAQRSIERFDWDSASFEETVNRLAEIHTDLNFAHPFREGNGRTTKVFMQSLANEHGVDLNWNEIDKQTWNEKSAATFLDPYGLSLDTSPLVEIYQSISVPPR